MSKNDQYLVFPLSLLQFINEDKKSLSIIRSYCLIFFSRKIKCNRDSVATQIIYLYKRRRKFLTKKVLVQLEKMFKDGRIEEDVQYHSFHNDKFAPKLELPGLIREFQDNDFFNDCVKIYQEHQAFSLFNIDFEHISYVRKHYDTAIKFLNEYQRKNGTDALTSISIEIFMNSLEGKVDLDCFRLICAIKSVIGHRNFTKTYTKVLLPRMFGSKKESILIELLSENNSLKKKYKSFLKRRTWDDLIKRSKEFVTIFSTGRGYYVSSIIQEKELKDFIEKKKYIKSFENAQL